MIECGAVVGDRLATPSRFSPGHMRVAPGERARLLSADAQAQVYASHGAETALDNYYFGCAYGHMRAYRLGEAVTASSSGGGGTLPWRLVGVMAAGTELSERASSCSVRTRAAMRGLTAISISSSSSRR